MAGVVTTRSSQWAPVLIAACIIVPQAIVALCSPSVGRKAQAWGRRPLLLIAFASLVVRGLLFATVRDPYLLVVVQVFDGITAAIFSVMVPLIVADVCVRQRPFQPGAGHRRHRGRHRRVAQHGAGRLCQRQARQRHRFHGPRRRRRARAVRDLAGDAGDAADGMTANEAASAAIFQTPDIRNLGRFRSRGTFLLHAPSYMSDLLLERADEPCSRAPGVTAVNQSKIGI